MDPVISSIEKYQLVLQFLHLQLTERASFSAPTARAHRERLLWNLAVRSHAQDNACITDFPQQCVWTQRRTRLSPPSNGRQQGILSTPSPPHTHTQPARPPLCLPVLTSNFQLNATFLRFYPLPISLLPQPGSGDDIKLKFKRKSQCLRTARKRNPQILPVILKM